ncbi:hypothetical protein GH714_028606 [Hevea brasiliensis]|uniref:CSN8/PSMD8/EIF3K domain-containing protein n=1 Tax=Hevea brasiliensis TaxID=3981 RepID=A0A6A6LUQ0_HEVBR|nr:hypothetical protein GH714_028606 [Hevea brasiliensis]
MGRERDTQKMQQQVSFTVEQLVTVNPYNPDILPDLENYVNEQVSSQTYSLDANLCLLRLYQFEPERLSTQIVARILVKTGRFRQFWDEAAKSRHIVEAVPENDCYIYIDYKMWNFKGKLIRNSSGQIGAFIRLAINIEGLSLDKFLEHRWPPVDGA